LARLAWDSVCFAVLVGLASAGAALLHSVVAFTDTSLEGRAALGYLSAITFGSISSVVALVLYPICFRWSDLAHVSAIIATVAGVAIGAAMILQAMGSDASWFSGVFALFWAVVATVREARRIGSMG